MKTEYLGRTIESGFLAPGYWAKHNNGVRPIYEGGYRTEQQAINAVKRKLDKRNMATDLANQAIRIATREKENIL